MFFLCEGCSRASSFDYFLRMCLVFRMYVDVISSGLKDKGKFRGFDTCGLYPSSLKGKELLMRSGVLHGPARRALFLGELPGRFAAEWLSGRPDRFAVVVSLQSQLTTDTSYTIAGHPNVTVIDAEIGEFLTGHSESYDMVCYDALTWTDDPDAWVSRSVDDVLRVLEWCKSHSPASTVIVKTMYVDVSCLERPFFEGDLKAKPRREVLDLGARTLRATLVWKPLVV